MLKIYGLKNCDTCKKAIKWLENETVEFEFIDIRNPAPSKEVLTNWLGQVGNGVLVNRRSTSWRGLSDDAKKITDDDVFVGMLHENATLIKRPIFERNGKIVVGFNAKNTENVTKLLK